MGITEVNFAALDAERLRQLSSLGVKLDCFFDVGASNCRWTQRLSQEFPAARFEMFEPLSDHLPAYQALMNPLLQANPRAHLHKYAVGARVQSVTMQVMPNPFGSTALERAVLPEARPVQVPMITIDEAIKRFSLPTPNVIKMDTQGSELAILRGASRALPAVDVLLLETWLTRAYGRNTPLLIELANWLWDRSFYFWDLADPYRDDRGVLIAQDFLFLNARTELSPQHREFRRRSRSVKFLLRRLLGFGS